MTRLTDAELSELERTIVCLACVERPDRCSCVEGPLHVTRAAISERDAARLLLEVKALRRVAAAARRLDLGGPLAGNWTRLSAAIAELDKP